MKNCLDFQLEYSVKEEQKNGYPVIIVAAGSASRMKGIDKLSAEINRIPVLAHTVMAFDSSNCISQIIVVTRKEKIETYLEYKTKFNIKKPYSVVEGGDSREESVLCGIECLKGKGDKVVIHDGARPVISQDVIERVTDALKFNDSVTCGVKVKDTVKVINEDKQAVKTLNRDSLMNIQTPQGVCVKKFCESAQKNNLSMFTDDTSVVEAVGAKTLVVVGDYKNIKITTPEDLVLAEVYLGSFGGLK